MKNNVIFGMGIFHTANGLKVLGQAKINVRQMSRGDSFGCVIFKNFVGQWRKNAASAEHCVMFSSNILTGQALLANVVFINRDFYIYLLTDVKSIEN